VGMLVMFEYVFEYVLALCMLILGMPLWACYSSWSIGLRQD
jgi:hypothetical protein